MPLVSWFRSIVKLLPRFRTEGSKRVRSVAEMKQIIDRERSRADRRSTQLSLLTVRIEGQPSDVTDRALDSICARIRCTDEIGWADRHHLAAVLPDTEAVGARKCGADLGEILASHGIRARWQVRVYPDDWYPTITASGRDREHAQSRNGQAATSRNGAVGAEAEIATETMTSDATLAPDRAPQQFAPPEIPMSLRETTLPPWKRLIDIVVASLALVIASPVMVAAAVAVKASSRGPVIFRQRRSGLGGHSFDFYKFRTMHVEAEARKHELLSLNEQSGPVFKIRKDPRITPVGRILRKSSIDELPQLWNVLKGDMSLVGPRPPTPDEIVHYEPWQRRRLDTVGGLTCIWQVSGRNEVQFVDWMRMDRRYIERRSFWGDILILLRTIPAVIRCRGAR